MPRSKRLQPVLQLAELKAKQGLQAIAYMQKRVEQEQDKLNQLSACKTDYDSDNGSVNTSMNACFLKSYSDFSQSLSLALTQQSQQVATVEAQLHEVQQMWRRLDGRCRTLQKTQAKLVMEERALENKKAQKDLDEFVSQSAARSGSLRGH